MSDTLNIDRVVSRLELELYTAGADHLVVSEFIDAWRQLKKSAEEAGLPRGDVAIRITWRLP